MREQMSGYKRMRRQHQKQLQAVSILGEIHREGGGTQGGDPHRERRGEEMSGYKRMRRQHQKQLQAVSIQGEIHREGGVHREGIHIGKGGGRRCLGINE